MIKKCTCDSAFQDKTYGHQMRIHTLSKFVNGKYTQCGCTVCGRVKDAFSITVATATTKKTKKEKKKGKK